MAIQQNQVSNDNFYLSEYTAARGDNGGEEEVKPIYFQLWMKIIQKVLHTLTTPRRRSGLKNVCLGEKRRLALPRASLEEHR